MGRRTSSIPSVMLISLLLSTLLLPCASAILQEGQVWNIAIGNPETEGIPFQKHDKALTWVNITGDMPGDAYIMKCSEAEKLKTGEPFKAVVTRENFTGFQKLEWTKTDDEDVLYCLVVDNSDNANPNDAVPTGWLYFEADVDWDDGHMRVWTYKLIAVGAVAGVAIFVTIVVVIRKMS